MRKKLISIIIAVLISLVFTGVLEAGIRFVQWTHPSESIGLDDLGINRYAYWPNDMGNLVPNQSGYWTSWKHRPFHVETNSLGLRNTEEPKSGAIRILTSGASLTFGAYVPNDDTWPAWLENNLRVRMKDAGRIQVFNGARTGYPIEERLKYVTNKGVRLKPDILFFPIFNSFLGDPDRPQASETVKAEGPFLSRLKFILRQHSAMYNLLAVLKRDLFLQAAREELAEGPKVAAHGETTAVTPWYTEQQVRLRTVLEQLSVLSKEQGITLIVLWGEIGFSEGELPINPHMRRFLTELSEELDFVMLDISGDVAQAGRPCFFSRVD